MTSSHDHTDVIPLDGTRPGNREVLGGKAYSVNRMRELGLPVPPAFALPTGLCATYHAHGRALPDETWTQVCDALRVLEKDTGRTFGRGPEPLLVSVRSGAAQSMPGMMDTVLNLGLTPDLVEQLALSSGDPHWADDTWERFRTCYSAVVLERPAEPGQTPPLDPYEQLRAAIGAVFDSWTNDRARAYRERHDLGDGGGTAVTVQAMVFGNRDARSATGVMFSRNPNSGAAELYGEWLVNAQGEDVVSGARTPEPLTSLQELSASLYAEVGNVAAALEQENRDLVDIEFTIESGILYMLQCRTGKRSPQAAVRIAADLVAEGVISPAEALERVTADHVASLADAKVIHAGAKVLASGLGACPGVAVGHVARDLDEIAEIESAGYEAILVRRFTAPDDVPAMFQSVGVVTEVGGTTSHAALVCREIGLPCIVGIGDGLVDQLAGRIVTVDGTTGNIYDGDVVDTPIGAEDPQLRRLIQLADAEGQTSHPVHQVARVDA